MMLVLMQSFCGDNAAAFVHLFFALPTNSSLRNAISSCVNKLAPATAQAWTSLFQISLVEEHDKHHLSSAVLRCFDNCWVAKAAALAVGSDLSARLLVYLEELQVDDLAATAVLRALLCLSRSGQCHGLDVTRILLPFLMSRSAQMDAKVNAALCILHEEQRSQDFPLKVLELR